MKKATIYDYARMCRAFNDCGMCPLFELCGDKNEYSGLDKINEIILKWCKEHPAETRQDRLLKMFPNARMDDGILAFNPCAFDDSVDCNGRNCFNCRKGYWLAEVDENE